MKSKLAIKIEITPKIAGTILAVRVFTPNTLKEVLIREFLKDTDISDLVGQQENSNA